MTVTQAVAECRGCGIKLVGSAYHLGGEARHPKTNEQCSVSEYGGYICSDRCYYEVNRIMGNSINDYIAESRWSNE